jgi:hypothetical protein
LAHVEGISRVAIKSLEIDTLGDFSLLLLFYFVNLSYFIDVSCLTGCK